MRNLLFFCLLLASSTAMADDKVIFDALNAMAIPAPCAAPIPGHDQNAGCSETKYVGRLSCTHWTSDSDPHNQQYNCTLNEPAQENPVVPTPPPVPR